MSTEFDVQKTSVYGSFGEFTIGDGANTIRAKYILTKIKPGDDRSWECELASKMIPWREIFKAEELSFDELLQRDLDDSRVAHELIPYLLGESGDRAKFFPPILAVIVPHKQASSGIEGFYPPRNVQDESVEKYGDLFDFEQMELGGQLTPLAKLSYNRQRSVFIIVDGQHRAMAVLALHRQLNDNWGDNLFESYYNHIIVTSEQVKNIELPTCIIYFPDLHEGNSGPREEGIDLNAVCREIFLVVNRNAKRVSKARELLLDDEDIAAHLMRKTLSKLKDCSEESVGSARIYSISYGDSDIEIGQKEVISGQLEYSSAIALHKIHRAISFGVRKAFQLKGYSDITQNRNIKNKVRPSEILLGTDVEKLTALPHNSGKRLPPDQVDKIVKKLGKLVDTTLMGLFDKFRPFEVHNRELRNLKMKLLQPHVQSAPEQKKAYALIFEGSGARNVFESHFEHLKNEKKKQSGGEQTIIDSLQSQINDCESVEKALDYHKQEFQCLRACRFFSINYEVFYKDDNDNRNAQENLEEKARKLFQTVSTQAFQLGYAMAIFTIVEELKREQSTASPLQYQDRLKLVQFVTEVYLAALNTYFSPTKNTVHRTLSGYITESRASVFDANDWGLRGFLAMSVNELNERQWPFFRYAILEIVHSPVCWNAAQEKMKQMNSDWTLVWYKDAIRRIVEGIISEREEYVKKAIYAALRDSDFRQDIMQKQTQARAEGKNETQIAEITEELRNTCKADTEKRARRHLKASLKKVENKEDMIKRLSVGI